MSSDACTKCTKCFNTLGVESRMNIFKFLRQKGPSTVSDIVGVAKLTQPTVSYHLREMKDVGLLASRRRGKEIFYRINEECPSCEERCFLLEVQFPK